MRETLPAIPQENYILEPARRDVAAAVALAFFTLEKDGVTGPVIFQWSDHYVKKADELVRLFETAKSLIESQKAGLVIVAQEPGFANDNLGWLKLEGRAGSSCGVDYHSFGEWVYRPPIERCEEMFKSQQWVWNTGHFVTSVEFMTSAFRTRAPNISAPVESIVSYRGTSQESSKLQELYPQLPSSNFDDVILKQIPRDQAYVVKADLGWVDPGNLNSLKEALQSAADDTVTRGNVICLRSKDAFIHNATDRPVAVMGVSNLIVVEMPDVTLVIDKGSVRRSWCVIERARTSRPRVTAVIRYRSRQSSRCDPKNH